MDFRKSIKFVFDTAIDNSSKESGGSSELMIVATSPWVPWVAALPTPRVELGVPHIPRPWRSYELRLGQAILTTLGKDLRSLLGFSPQLDMVLSGRLDDQGVHKALHRRNGATKSRACHDAKISTKTESMEDAKIDFHRANLPNGLN
jgi:hypothetical protein